jgi:ATP-dependent Lon protease
MSERQTLPVIALRDAVIFPSVAMPIGAGRSETLRAIELAAEGDGRVFAVRQRQTSEAVEPTTLHTLGVIAKISQVQHGEGKTHVLLEGLTRATALEYRTVDGRVEAVCLPVRDLDPIDSEDATFIALHEELRTRAALLAKKRGVPEPLMARVLRTVTSAATLSDLVAAHLEIPGEEKQALL